MIHSTLPLDDPEILELVQLFVQLLHEHMDAMREAWAESDLARLADLAHMIKGSAGNAGFDILFAPVEELERLVREEKSDQIEACLSKLQILVSRVALPSAVTEGDEH